MGKIRVPQAVQILLLTLSFMSKHFAEACSGLTYIDATTSSQVITSPNYPSSYTENQLCSWLIVASDTSHNLKFEVDSSSILEQSKTCEYDYVEIFDGDSITATSLGKFCGTSALQYVTTGHQAYVKFVSDYADNYKGFSLSVESGDGLTVDVTPEEDNTAAQAGAAVGAIVAVIVVIVVIVIIVKVVKNRKAKKVGTELPAKNGEPPVAHTDEEAASTPGSQVLSNKESAVSVTDEQNATDTTPIQDTMSNDDEKDVPSEDKVEELKKDKEEEEDEQGVEDERIKVPPRLSPLPVKTLPEGNMEDENTTETVPSSPKIIES